MILGLTGGIGSGKSTIAKVFQVLGHPVFEADRAGREVLESDTEVIRAVKSLFGDDVYKDGKADRKQLASLVFGDSKKLEALNAIIHPAVGRSWKAWVSKHTSATLLVREAAILFESGSYKDCDKVLTISAPQDVRIRRVMDRDGVSAEEVKARMARQWSDVQRRQKADFEIVNDEQEAVIPQVLVVLQKCKRLP